MKGLPRKEREWGPLNPKPRAPCSSRASPGPQSQAVRGLDAAGGRHRTAWAGGNGLTKQKALEDSGRGHLATQMVTGGKCHPGLEDVGPNPKRQDHKLPSLARAAEQEVLAGRGRRECRPLEPLRQRCGRGWPSGTARSPARMTTRRVWPPPAAGPPPASATPP